MARLTRGELRTNQRNRGDDENKQDNDKANKQDNDNATEDTKLTEADIIPERSRTARSTLDTQEAQCIPTMRNNLLCVSTS